MSSQGRSRANLIEAVIRASWESSTAAVFFHTAMAEQVGLGATEEKTLFILSNGPLTAGEIALQTGLTTASVTSLLDRLERKEFVQRVRDVKDRRKVIVEANAEKLAELNRLFGSYQEAYDDFLSAYTDEQLATIADYLSHAARHAREAIDMVRSGNATSEEAETKR